MNDASEIIRIFTVGGTIDKIYFDAKSSYEVGPPNIGEILGGLKLNPRFDVTPLMQKDSLDMDDLDRARVKEAVSGTEDRRIIITHGTDTMVHTAAQLGELALQQGKTIVLTGALEPARFKTSDAMFNIGAAITAVQILPPGVYITMNGQVFDHDKVVKDVERGRFVSL
ncbi:MAG: asparaginase domain-containing protein [Proteobacteria bacterium]|nr:asparaginase domain-containing protein [Pseudomonadota bacterium]MDA0928562.1 asparaginase domain-containing protein [Pseudomonadota bacterium]